MVSLKHLVDSQIFCIIVGLNSHTPPYSLSLSVVDIHVPNRTNALYVHSVTEHIQCSTHKWYVCMVISFTYNKYRCNHGEVRGKKKKINERVYDRNSSYSVVSTV